ncbi:MAG TPA: GSU2403 family nucleotidyltransferase fold protein [Thermodesulfovibrionales bacterium]|nr:GSU2403 family nucleotidyltransferase fold protein [Thermodesulfovibrionales bacterium]
MRITVKNKDIFPSEVRELFQALHAVGFFEESMLIGSWVMPLYQEVFSINYILRTLDIDFAVKFIHQDRDRKVDIEKLITDLGYIPVIMQSGIRRFTRENFTIEFVIHRKGGRNDEIVSVKQWNITASPLPFVDLLLSFPLIADFEDFEVRAPIPEAYFVHKMITSQRRRGESKKDKDLEQCSIIAPQIDLDRLKSVVETLKISKKTQKVIRDSCEVIDFPPQKLGLR